MYQSNFIIFSVCQGKDQRADTLNTAFVAKALADSEISFFALRGRYKGTDELSFAVKSDEQAELFARGYASIFNQETILTVNAAGQAFLSPPDASDAGPRPTLLGQWTKATMAMAEEMDAYTFDPITNTYYIVKG